MMSAASTTAAEGGTHDGETAMVTTWGWWRELGGGGRVLTENPMILFLSLFDGHAHF